MKLTVAYGDEILFKVQRNKKTKIFRGIIQDQLMQQTSIAELDKLKIRIRHLKNDCNIPVNRVIGKQLKLPI